MGKKSGKKKTTLTESFIQFQIDVKRKEIEEFKKDVEELEAKNELLVKLRDRLRKEHKEQLSVYCKQAKDQEKLKEKELAKYKEVEQAAQYNLELAHDQEKELAEVHSKLTDIQAQSVELQVQKQVWQEYKHVGRFEHQRQIQKLHSRLDCIRKTFQAATESIKCSLKATSHNNDQNNSGWIRVGQVSKKTALRQSEQQGFLMNRKNIQLKEKIAAYRDEVSVMDEAVRKLEEENLEHVRHLVEHRLSDAQTSSNVFLKQAEDLEQKHSPPERAAETGREQLQQSVELKEDEMDHSHKPSSSTHHLSALVYGSQSDLREPLHVDPLEQKLLCVVGRAMPLSPLPSDSEELETLTCLGLIQPQEGSLTTRIIRRRFQ